MLTESNFNAFLTCRNAIDAMAQYGELPEFSRAHAINTMYEALQWLEAQLVASAKRQEAQCGGM